MHAQGTRKVLLGLLLAAFAVTGWAYRESWLGLPRIWSTDATFSHGYLILPIVLWLVWRVRREVAAVEWRPSLFGLLASGSCAAVWMVARGTGVLVVEQLATVAIVPALTLAVLGTRATRVLAFPLAFLFFAVPLGKGLVPLLMQLTADLSVGALKLFGLPVYRSGMFISIPGGDFEVARACSGINYLVTSVVLGTLYAYVSYRSWRKRLLFIAAAVVVPILANGLRVFFIVVAAHYSDMRLGTGPDHVVFGRVMFLSILFAMFWIGRRWQDPDPAGVAGSAATPARLGGRDWLAAILPVLLLAATPRYLDAATALARLMPGDPAAAVALPTAAPGWRAAPDMIGWAPLYADPVAEARGVYLDRAGAHVDLYVASYGLGVGGNAEMIAYRNRLYAQEHQSRYPERVRTVDLGGRPHAIREVVLPAPEGERVVWTWYRVGERTATSPFHVKALEALLLLGRQAVDERVVTLAAAAVDADAARAALEDFAAAHGDCLARGLAPGSGCAP
jgi:exosortase A